MAKCEASFGYLGRPCCFVAVVAPSGFCFQLRQQRRRQQLRLVAVIATAPGRPFAIAIAGLRLAVTTTAVIAVVVEYQRSIGFGLRL